MAIDIAAGTMLVAGVDITDGVFDQTVVLIVDADQQGTVGVVLNRLAKADLAKALPSWEPLVTAPRVLFDGGPVSQQGAICLATPAVGGEEPPGWRPVFDRVGLLNLDTPIELARGAYTGLRVFAGYAGWDAGQLEAEVGFGMWHVVAALPGDPFDIDPLTLWRRVLRRQGGDLALLSTWTSDIECN